MLILTLAWRNIWRNRRRTLITMSSIILAIMLSSLMASMQQGQYNQMIQASVGSFTGHIQIQAPKYFKEPSIEHSLIYAEDLKLQLIGHQEIKSIIPRLDSYALVSGNEKSKAAMIMGIDIDAENGLSNPKEKIVKGSYFESNAEHQAIISEGLSRFLDVTLGDSLVIIGSGFHGVSAADLIPIKGIIKFPIPELNNSLVYLPLATAQSLYGAYDRVTYISLILNRAKYASQEAQLLVSELTEKLNVYDWKQIVPELVQAIQADRGSGYIIIFILYVVVAFGIFGTILMMTMERKYELGIMLAIGTPKMRIANMLITELSIITLFASCIGLLLSIPIIYFFHLFPLEFSGNAAEALIEYGMEPFIRFSVDPLVLIVQASIVSLLSICISIYPAVFTYKLSAIKAMKS